MTEAEKYTTKMWQRHLSEIASTMLSTDASDRRAFRGGFYRTPLSSFRNSNRDAYNLGRQTAVLLGYIEADAEKSDG